eukprot:s175_g23.t1
MSHVEVSVCAALAQSLVLPGFLWIQSIDPMAMEIFDTQILAQKLRGASCSPLSWRMGQRFTAALGGQNIKKKPSKKRDSTRSTGSKDAKNARNAKRPTMLDSLRESLGSLFTPKRLQLSTVLEQEECDSEPGSPKNSCERRNGSDGAHPFAPIHPVRAATDPDWKHAVSVFMGLTVDKGPGQQTHSVDLRRTVVRFVEIINSWPDMSQHTGQCEMRVRDVRRRDLPSYAVPDAEKKPKGLLRAYTDDIPGEEAAPTSAPIEVQSVEPRPADSEGRKRKLEPLAPKAAPLQEGLKVRKISKITVKLAEN